MRLEDGFVANVIVCRDRTRVREVNNISWYLCVGGLTNNDICGWPQFRCSEDDGYDGGGYDEHAAVVTYYPESLLDGLGKVKVKVKFTLEQATKDQRGSWVIVLSL
jgi:hypothetical protein